MSAEGETHLPTPSSALAPNIAPFGGQPADATEAEPTPFTISAPALNLGAMGGQLHAAIEADVWIRRI